MITLRLKQESQARTGRPRVGFEGALAAMFMDQLRLPGLQSGTCRIIAIGQERNSR